MSDDRKQLELAAKAIGRTIIGWNHQTGAEVAVFDDQSYWQPLLKNGLTDCDGDALRLAVKLTLEIDHNSPSDNNRYVCISRCGIEVVRDPVCIIDEFEDESERVAIARRAIVRAAASIGKSMP